jgi:hypothetical protein
LEKFVLSTPHRGQTQLSGNFFKGGAGRNISFRAAYFGIIHITAHVAYIFFHDSNLFLVSTEIYFPRLSKFESLDLSPEWLFRLYHKVAK